MKKTFLSVLIATNFNLSSQNSISLMHDKTLEGIPHNSVLYVEATPSLKTTVTIDIKNISSVTQTYDVKRYDILLNEVTPTEKKANAFFCFAGMCYDSSTFISGDELVLQSGVSASDLLQISNSMLDADMIEARVKGLSIIKYTFVNINNSNDSAQITIRYNDPSSTVGLRDLNQNISNFSIYPNPANDLTSVNVVSASNQDGTMRLFNSLGEMVYEKEVMISEGKNNLPLNVTNLAAGVYMVQFCQNTTVIARKLLVE